MLEARLNRDSVPGEKCELRRAARQAFEGLETVRDRKLPDRIHLRIKVEWRKTRPRVADLGNPAGHCSLTFASGSISINSLLLNGGSLKKVKRPLHRCVG